MTIVPITLTMDSFLKKPFKVTYKHWHTNWRMHVKVNDESLPRINIENDIDANFLNSFENEIKQEILPYLTVESIKYKIYCNSDFKYGLNVEAKDFLGIEQDY